MEDVITLDYGSGGQKTAELIDSLLVPAFSNPALNDLGDGAVLEGNGQLVFSTDSFVVSPWKFPGGNIGRLCVCGTVNDLCMAGGLPKYLSLSLILEEGFPLSCLQEIVASISEEAARTGVIVATGDTKVVEKGKGDGIYINTAGIGFLRAPFLGKDRIREGDRVLLSGSAGCHGAAVMMARAGLVHTDSAKPGNALVSDCAPLTKLSAAALASGTIRSKLSSPIAVAGALSTKVAVAKIPSAILLDSYSTVLEPFVPVNFTYKPEARMLSSKGTVPL